MWLEMLGLFPLPERRPLRATCTGALARDGYVVEKIHFQCIPGAYVPGNLYRPAVAAGRLPAVLYLCGHSRGKVNPPYQAHPRWFAQHGYIALVLDPIQLGEAQGVHGGTHANGRWDWFSRGYTPAGTEVWNAMRALDYLESRPDVDGSRMGVTGLSGGGAMSWFLGAADERVKCVVPVCQTGSIEQHVLDRTIDGHCDCAFWINYYRWCTPDVGALIAPRPLLIASGTEDVIWRPYAFRDVFHRIRRQYAELGSEGLVELVEDVSPHGYTPKLRKAIFEWFNLHLKGDAQPVADDVTDYVEPDKNLLVFKGRPPRRDSMRAIDTLLVKKAAPPPVNTRARWEAYRRKATSAMRSLTFRHVSQDASGLTAEFRRDGLSNACGELSSIIFKAPDGVTLRARLHRRAGCRAPLLAFALPENIRTGHFGTGCPPVGGAMNTASIEVRNTAATSVGPGYLWTLRRSYALVGQTLPERQIQDLLAGIEAARRQIPAAKISLYGEGRTAVLAIYAAILNPGISEVVLANPPDSHQSPEAPDLMGILRIGDLPWNLALLWPRPITFIGKMPPAYRWTEKLYLKLGSGGAFRRLSSMQEWKPRGLKG